MSIVFTKFKLISKQWPIILLLVFFYFFDVFCFCWFASVTLAPIHSHLCISNGEKGVGDNDNTQNEKRKVQSVNNDQRAMSCCIPWQLDCHNGKVSGHWVKLTRCGCCCWHLPSSPQDREEGPLLQLVFTLQTKLKEKKKSHYPKRN